MKDIINKSKSIVKAIIIKNTGLYSEDLEQEVYIKTWKNINAYKEQNKFISWIATITKNTCKDYLKSKSYKMSSISATPIDDINNVKDNKTPESEYDSKIRQKIIMKAINNLPSKMREVVILYELEEKTYEDIAKKMNIPIGTVKSRLNNARRVLKNVLQELL